MSSIPIDPLEDLAIIPDPQERLSWVVDKGKKLPVFEGTDRDEAYRVPGCVSRVWLVDESQDSICRFRGDAEAPILRGLIALILSRTNGRSAKEGATDDTDVITALEIERHLTPTPVNGLRSLQAHIRNLASRWTN
jgi:cysteine desulfuration protein SufE